MPIMEIKTEECVNCGTCVEICPLDVLRSGEEKPEIKYREDCQSCFLCLEYCKTKAIVVTAERARASSLPW